MVTGYIQTLEGEFYRVSYEDPIGVIEHTVEEVDEMLQESQMEVE